MRSCQHGFNSACLICGFSQIEGKRVWFDWAFKHQQSKVDELQKQKSLQELEINQIAHANQQWQLKCGELQKRVDSILKVVQSMRNEVKHGHISGDESQTLSSYANDLEQALKGGIK